MYRTILLILMFAAFQLISSSCSRMLYTEASFSNIESKAEKKKLKEFMAEGTEMKINTSNASPEKVIKTAEKYLGVPHCMGGTTSKCMDCSGLLVTVFAAHGIRLPHNSEDQARYGKIINGTDKLKRGDLVFFVRSYKTNRFITHSGIYLGNNRFIHASTTNGVTITSLSDPWWSGKFIFGTRLFD